MNRARVAVVVVVLALFAIWVAYSISAPTATRSGPTASQSYSNESLSSIAGGNFKVRNVTVYVRFDQVEGKYFVRVDYEIVHTLNSPLLFLNSSVILHSITTANGEEQQIGNVAHNTKAISIGPSDVYKGCAEFGPLPDRPPTDAKVTIAVYIQNLPGPVSWNFNATNMSVIVTSSCGSTTAG